MIKYEFPTYRDIHNLVTTGDFYNEIKDFDPNYILSVGRGGYVPSSIISNALNGQQIINVGITTRTKVDPKHKGSSLIPYQVPDMSLFEPGDRILVVDDITDTGRTLKFIDSIFRNYNLHLKFSSVYCNSQQQKQLDEKFKLLYADTVDNDNVWIVMPWEKHP